MKTNTTNHTFKSRRLVPLMLLAISVPLPSGANTNVSRLPDFDYATHMSRFVSTGQDSVIAVPNLPGGTLRQLAYDGWEWKQVGAHAVSSWLPFDRTDSSWTFAVGDEVLLLGTVPAGAGKSYQVPALGVMRLVGGNYQPSQVLTMESISQDPNVFDFSFFGVAAYDGIVVIKCQVSLLGIGGVPKVVTFIKSGDQWITGPQMTPERGLAWWPLSVEVIDGQKRLRSVELASMYDQIPRQFKLVDHRFEAGGFVKVAEYQFSQDRIWDINFPVRALYSADGDSMVLVGMDANPVWPVELRRIGGAWTYQGIVGAGSIDFSDLRVAAVGVNQALLRSGSSPQHYHLLRHTGPAWLLHGDLPSHRYLDDYYYNTVFYSLGDERLTIFDIGFGNRTARSYTVPHLQPILVKWFRDSVTIDESVERIPALGFFAPQFSPDGQGAWIYHWNLGWLYLTGRDSRQFWFWSPALGWTWYSDQLYDRTRGIHWLYAGQQSDYLWNLPESLSPSYFYSYKLAEWISDTVAPPLGSEDLGPLLEQLKQELATEGVSLSVDMQMQIATFTYSEVVDGKLVTVKIDAPWRYITGTGYSCQARFEMDLYVLQITLDGQTSYVASTDLWTQAGVRLPVQLIMDFIFLTPSSGVSFETVRFNDGTQEGPVRETF